MRGNVRLLAVSVLAGVLALPLGAAAQATAEDTTGAPTVRDKEARREETRREEARRRADDRPERPRDGHQLALDCRAFRHDDRDAVGCRWSPSKDRAFAGYRLMRVSRTERPTPVFTTRDRAATKAVDTTVARDTGYVYMVQVLNAEGKVIGHSNPVRVHTGKPQAHARPAPARPRPRPLPGAPRVPGLPLPGVPEPPALPAAPGLPGVPGL